MKLFHRTLGEGKPLIILHGLLGSSDNWISVARELSIQYKIYLVDMRNHGQSPHSDVFNYDVMSDDLLELIEENDIQNPSIIGHSMGGKAAMKFAITHTDRWDKLIVVDIGPKAYPVHHQTILDGLNAVDLLHLASREAADEQLSAYVKEAGTRQFLLKNLTRIKEGGYAWKANIPVIEKNIEEVGKELEEKLVTEKDVLFIRGAKSDYIKEDDINLITQFFPGARVETIKNAGHWVHAEQPTALIEVVKKFLEGRN